MKTLLLAALLCLCASPAWAPPIESQSCDDTGCTIVATDTILSFTVVTVGIVTTLTVFHDGVQVFQGSTNNATCAVLETSAGNQVQARLANQFNIRFHCVSVNPLNITLISYNNGVTPPARWWDR